MKLARKIILILIAPTFLNISNNTLFGLSTNPDTFGPNNFAKTFCKFFTNQNRSFSDTQQAQEIVWENSNTTPFNELIVSWNSLRPSTGFLTFWVSVKHQNKWTSWHRLAQWGPRFQQTFVNKLNRYVHTKHCRIEMQKNHLAYGFRVKMTCHQNADPASLKAFFGCVSQLQHFKISHNYHNLPSILIKGIPRQSQMILDHLRFRDLCSPVSISMLVAYFHRKLYGRNAINSMHDFAINIANKVHDQGYLDIYGNWILNTAQAFDSCNGDVFFRVERINSFRDLHSYLSKNIPIAVSVRRLPGGATPYANGHIMIVAGWDQKKHHVLCIDPAFANNNATPKAYRLRDFLHAWGRSNNLAYVPLLLESV